METSGQTDIFEGVENTPPNIACMADVSDTSQETSRTRKKALSREIVDELHLWMLIVAYNVHFKWYSQGKINDCELAHPKACLAIHLRCLQGQAS